MKLKVLTKVHVRGYPGVADRGQEAAHVAKAYGTHPNTADGWRRSFLENGPETFAQDGERVAELERLLGETAIAASRIATF